MRAGREEGIRCLTFTTVITGGAGFVGPIICNVLCTRGRQTADQSGYPRPKRPVAGVGITDKLISRDLN